ncbi:hypothetical protein Tco_1135311 [Tanacetum coccineum]
MIPTLRRNLLGDVKIPKVGGSLNGYPQAEVEKWKENFPTTLDEDALNISTDGREEDFLSLNRVYCSRSHLRVPVLAVLDVSNGSLRDTDSRQAGRTKDKTIEKGDSHPEDGAPLSLCIGDLEPLRLDVLALKANDVSLFGKIGMSVEAEMVSPEAESEKWRRLLLHWTYDALNISTDGREEDFFP